jgi:hypothetical protein
MSETKKTIEAEAEEFKKKKRTPVRKVNKADESIRNEFAAAALSGLLAAARERVNADEAVEEAFRYADLMLLQLQKEKEAG